jgi:hypothetical protein
MELFPEADKKGVLVFSKKGDALRFCFSNENGNSVIITPYAGISLFKASRDEIAIPVNKTFYPLYEKAKTQSKITTEQTSRSKNIMELNSKIMFLKAQIKNVSGNEDTIIYLDKLRKISTTLDSLPLFYVRRLLDVDIDNHNVAIIEFKNIVPEYYIDIIISKDEHIINEVENIILSEQFI